MENHFDKNYELEERLKESGKLEQVKMIQDIADMANIYYIRQKEPKGLGHAVLCAKSFIGDEPFAVLLGDDVVVNKEGKPALKQLIEQYSKTSASVIGVQTVDKKDVSKYGIVEPSKSHPAKGRLVKLTDMVEKPAVEKAPSQLAVLGRYVLTPEIFEWLETQGKVWLYILGLALPATAISNMALVKAIKHIGPTLTSIFGAMEPLTAVFIGIVVFHETSTIGGILGMLLIIIAVFIVVVKENRK